ncbi:KPN_02809 family neutral zinc metallopeptidase [Nocardioides campestrisoli]|uniref:KPN_02809 family neutral zinc metallopeptidase n=1 Tax=Nocardioides campestrisoli TaxID=2736757 RepID=UPI00163D7EE6|nr:neutral zinc metallopeptidase [Nocardioides campestrisoli]
MRFNPKADIRRGSVRDAGGRRGGGGAPARLPMPGGAKAGGGLGAIVLVVLFLVLTQCVGGTTGTGGGTAFDQGGGTGGLPSGLESQSERYDHCRTGADAQDDPDCARKAVALSLERYWATTLPREAGVPLTPAQINTFTGQVATACGQASAQVGPFYCPADEQVYLDTTFFEDVLEGRLGGQGGDFVEPYVLAHEYGHHIQNLMGTMGKVRTQQGPESDAVRLELQADCYAGMWTRAAAGTTDDSGTAIFAELDEGDIAEALDSAKAVGDDRIQQRSGGRVDPEGWTHGSAAQRQSWFNVGYDGGDLAACDTFAADDL